MINKKILAASIAATFAFNANAVVDINTATTALTYGVETIASGGVIATNAALDTKVNVGLNLPASTKFYARFELTNAKFATSALVLGDLTLGGATTPVITIEGGGATADTYAVFAFQDNGAAIASTQEFTLAVGTGGVAYTVVDNSLPVTITYKLYQAADSLAALNGGAGEATSASLAAISFPTGKNVSGSFTATNLVADVGDQFTEFTVGNKIGNIGTVKLLPAAATVLDAADSTSVAAADAFNISAIATITGDFSFGTWHVDLNAACSTTPVAGTTVTVAADMLTGTVPALDYATANQYLCVTVDGTEVIPRVNTAYSVSLAGALNTGVVGSLGGVSYNSTSITIPYLTTYTGYNQRVYILNNGANAAPYTTTFQTEGAVTATAGTAATGTVPAKSLLAVKATDMVTFSGGTRGAAVIEIEATSGNIEATTQIVNKGNAGTDTFTLVDM